MCAERTVLVVDDEKVVCDRSARILERQGFKDVPVIMITGHPGVPSAAAAMRLAAAFAEAGEFDTAKKMMEGEEEHRPEMPSPFRSSLQGVEPWLLSL